MIIPVPIEEGRPAAHFGRCPCFMMFTINDRSREIIDRQTLPAPPHAPGAYPRWLRGHGADVVLARGMGRKALRLFTRAGICVVLGVPSLTAEELVAAYLDGELSDGINTCTHGPDHHCPN